MLLCGVTNARSKGPGVHLTRRACVRVCALLCVCTRVNAVHNQSACRGSTYLHEDESVSWSIRTMIPHIHFNSIHANGLVGNCAWLTVYHVAVKPVGEHVRRKLQWELEAGGAADDSCKSWENVVKEPESHHVILHLQIMSLIMLDEVPVALWNK